MSHFWDTTVLCVCTKRPGTHLLSKLCVIDFAARAPPVIRLRGRRNPHQDLEGPLIEITQPSISNRWVTGGPPLVLISHPSGMTSDEEGFYTENHSTWLSPNWAWMGTPICPHLRRKTNKGMAHYTALVPHLSPPQTPLSLPITLSVPLYLV